MGGNRKKKPGVQNAGNHAKTSSVTTITSSKPDEAAASSMSSDSSEELIIATATSDSLVKLSSTTLKNSNNNIKSRINEIETLWECSNEAEDTSYSSNNPQTSFRFSWNEILALCFLLLSFALCSIIVGVAAGVSISIHYYESPENVDQRRMSTNDNNNNIAWRDNSRVVTQKVTSIDPTILSYSKNYYPNKEERVLHTDASTGMRIALNVVVESPSLNSTAMPFIQQQANSTHYANEGENFYIHHEGNLLRPPNFSGADDVKSWLNHPPKLCTFDSKTIGYDSYKSLRNALHDLNQYSAQRSDRWLAYFTNLAIEQQQQQAAHVQSNQYSDSRNYAYHSYSHARIPVFDDDNFYYEEQFVFTICPNAILKADLHPIFINTESVRIECEGCTIKGGDSHMSFGSAARNAVIRGIQFQDSKRSSILFHQNGAEATFEDCIWVVKNVENDKRHRHIMPGLKEISNVNSSSILKLYRCSTMQSKISQFSPFTWWWKVMGLV